MILKRSSPNDRLPLAGRTSQFGDHKSLSTIVRIEAHANQAKPKPVGRCEHNKRLARQYESSGKKRPSVIDEAIKAVGHTYKRAKLLAKLFYRKQRVHSQRREAIILVLQVMLQYMDLETFEIGFFNDSGDFIRLDTAKIASYAKITEIRAKRAIHDITEAGYLTTIRQYKITDDGRKIGQTAIRTISRSLFRDLNIDHLSIFKASEWKRKRNEKKLAKKNKARLRELLGSVGKLADKTTSSSFSAIRKATVLLEHVAKEIMPIIHKIEKAK